MVATMVRTFYAPVKRDPVEKIQWEVEFVSQNPVITGLLEVVGGLLAVLNEHRQILAVNENLLSLLGIDDAAVVLGLRPGEALNCIYSKDMPGGCGTGRFCASCGAAIAIVTSLSENQEQEQRCVLKAQKDGEIVELFLLVRAQPIVYQNERLVLLFLQDITEEQHRATVERVFYHDINNILTGLIGISDLLMTKSENGGSHLAVNVNHLAVQLMQEIKIQQTMITMNTEHYRPILKNTLIQDIFKDLRLTFSNHSAAEGKSLEFYQEIQQEQPFKLDRRILHRILTNMILNALEATQNPGLVKVSVEQLPDVLKFSVWNQEVIPPAIRPRIFQRNFSTKDGLGRGLGTYSMKLFGEQVLCGKVGFHTSETEGTTFYLEVPIEKT